MELSGVSKVSDSKLTAITTGVLLLTLASFYSVLILLNYSGKKSFLVVSNFAFFNALSSASSSAFSCYFLVMNFFCLPAKLLGEVEGIEVGSADDDDSFILLF